MQREHSWNATARQDVAAENTGSSDTALLMQVQQRDEHALALLYDRYGRLVYTIALRITGDQLVAEEVVQDAFYAIWQSAGSFQLDRSARAWMIGIVRHRAIDALRTRQYRARARETVLTTSATMDVLTLPDDQLRIWVLGQVVRDALANLSVPEQQVIGLAYYGGLTGTEIAARLRLPLGTVKSRLRSALMKLRAAVGADPE
jgi:RNA polymerase sigma-70 factor (ECF subfamily)